jgi:hypothetical protein
VGRCTTSLFVQNSCFVSQSVNLIIRIITLIHVIFDSVVASLDGCAKISNLIVLYCLVNFCQYSGLMSLNIISTGPEPNATHKILLLFHFISCEACFFYWLNCPKAQFSPIGSEIRPQAMGASYLLFRSGWT